MKKALFLSIRPIGLAKILNGEKSVEIRKRVPKWVLEEIAKGNSIDVYCYCTKGTPIIWFDKGLAKYIELPDWKFKNWSFRDDSINGLIPCKFTLKKVDKVWHHPGKKLYAAQNMKDLMDGYYIDVESYVPDAGIKACLTDDEIDEYANGKSILALRITDLEIFEMPMELENFCKINLAEDKTAIDTRNIKADCEANLSLTKAPQSMQTVYVNE